MRHLRMHKQGTPTIRRRVDPGCFERWIGVAPTPCGFRLRQPAASFWLLRLRDSLQEFA